MQHGLFRRSSITRGTDIVQVLLQFLEYPATD
jgi:hypothetical protein